MEMDRTQEKQRILRAFCFDPQVCISCSNSIFYKLDLCACLQDKEFVCWQTYYYMNQNYMRRNQTNKAQILCTPAFF